MSNTLQNRQKWKIGSKTITNQSSRWRNIPGSGAHRSACREISAVRMVRAGVHSFFRMSRQMAPVYELMFGCQIFVSNFIYWQKAWKHKIWLSQFFSQRLLSSLLDRLETDANYACHLTTLDGSISLSSPTKLAGQKRSWLTLGGLNGYSLGMTMSIMKVPPS